MITQYKMKPYVRRWDVEYTFKTKVCSFWFQSNPNKDFIIGSPALEHHVRFNNMWYNSDTGSFRVTTNHLQ